MPVSPLSPPELTLRPARPSDQPALRRLAALDSTPAVPAGPLLLAEVDGELRVALSLLDQAAIADPFHPTAHLLQLLRAHAQELEMVRRRPARRLRPRLSLARG